MPLVITRVAPPKLTIRVGAIVLCLACAQCGGGNSRMPPTSPTPTIPGPPTFPTNPVPPANAAPQVFAGAGDIARCNEGNAMGVSRLLDTIGGTIFTLGDNAYMNGTAREFSDCYEPTWGRHKSRTRPAPGNHEYATAGALPYFEYFGANAGYFGQGYYSFDLGAWHIISLNSEISTAPNSPQGAWLGADLEAHNTRCTLAYWHKPLFSSGPNGDHPHMRPFFEMLYNAGADVILTGHDHLYERFGQQDPDGRPDSRLGIRQFIVGTGGVPLYEFRAAVKPNSEKRIREHGILKLTLMSDSYTWEFLPVANSALDRDQGADTCH
jgi:acid phosphatase type 7